MKKLFFYFISMSLLLLASCQDAGFDSNGRYEIEKDNSGKLIVFDTKKGSVEIIENGIKSRIQEEAQVSAVKTFRTQKIPGLPVEISDLKVKYRNGALLYQGMVQPIIKGNLRESKEENSTELDKSISEKYVELFPKLEAIWEGDSSFVLKNVTIYLNDKDNFNVSQFTINYGDLKRVVNNEAKSMYFSFDGSQNIDLRTYAAISDYNFTWYLGKWSSE